MKSGAHVDESADRAEPFKITLNSDPDYEEISGMVVSEKRRFIVPPNRAQGAYLD